MKHFIQNHHKTGRREFINKLTLTFAAGFTVRTGFRGPFSENVSAGATTKPDGMPMIKLGNYMVSRLICGCNPMLGYSYLGQHTDRQMKEYFTPERIIEFLDKCRQAGINTHQSSFRTDYFSLLNKSDSGLNIISLQQKREDIKSAIETARPIAIVHHGGVSDRLFAAGKPEVVHDFVKEVKDKGLLAGVSAHNPDVIRQIADEGWKVDFFMTCFYFLTRRELKGVQADALPVGSYDFMRKDPEIMTNVIREVDQPCLAFKILGAGRRCSGQDDVRSAFKFAFENIKPTDGVIVGMFPWFFDEISADAQYTEDLGSKK